MIYYPERDSHINNKVKTCLPLYNYATRKIASADASSTTL